MKTAEDWWKERGGRVWLEDLRTEPAVVDVEAIRAIQRDALAELKAENNRLREALAAAEKVVEAARVYTSDFECDFFAAYDKLKEEK